MRFSLKKTLKRMRFCLLTKYSTNAENWRHQCVIIIIAVAGLIDSLICICTLGFYETGLRFYFALEVDCLDDWANDEQMMKKEKK